MKILLLYKLKVLSTEIFFFNPVIENLVSELKLVFLFYFFFFIFIKQGYDD